MIMRIMSILVCAVLTVRALVFMMSVATYITGIIIYDIISDSVVYTYSQVGSSYI